LAKKIPGRNGGTLNALEKGETANPNGRPKNLFKKFIHETEADEFSSVVRAMFTKAKGGDVQAFKALVEAGFGKDFNLAGQDDKPAFATLVIELPPENGTADNKPKIKRKAG